MWNRNAIDPRGFGGRPHKKNSASLTLAIAAGLLLSGKFVAADQLLSAIDPAVQGARQAPAQGLAETRFRPGDKLKIAIYEQIENEEDKWGTKNKAPLKNFALRTEMSGDYVVQADGSVTIPMLGPFVFVSRGASDLSADCAAAFQKSLGRPAVVNIALVERMPISVVGPVRQPGVYAFAQGMTVLHAIARAGGFEEGPKDSWSRIEVSRERGKAEISNENLKKVLAEASVLHAERDHTRPASEKLVAMVGAEEAQKLIAAAAERRRTKTRADDERRNALNASIDGALKTIELARARISPLEQTLALKRERMASLKKLLDHGTVTRPIFIQAQAEASEIEDKKLSTQNVIVEAEQRLTLLRSELKRLETDLAADLEQQITRLDREASEASLGLNASAGVLSALKSTNALQRLERSTLAYTVVRPKEGGPEVLSADEYFQLQPGDLVRIDLNVAGR
ncbi:polysaccharide biosynthesis/export family protein [Methylocystis parvus]|uniref:Soluble ligand binding domain-containing protein n=1 Tax=Methylocystis parvus TaxID=134 RepID=A0A6B8M2G0_9HYPH|nr:SLBB domain-containing protein [Methylocystis parvus]QGM99047.1 hypothetical protein F7D14_17195 [Methylocystis parvus]WBK00586.1 SLBB domain-containing protein [Methylocystis parvus OBBP]